MAVNSKQSKTIANTVETMASVNKLLNDLITEFGAVELIKPIDSYLFGAIRTVQSSCLYLSDFASDLDKQSKPSKTQVNPILKEE